MTPTPIDDSQRVVPVELLPCPFCNAEPAYFSGTNIQYGHGESSDYAGVRCSVCRVEISFCNYAGYQLTERMALAAEKWNRRAPAASPAVAPVVVDEVLLPCDVAVAPATCFRAGVPLAMVLRSIETRRDGGAPHHFPPKGRFAPLAAAQDGVSVVAWRMLTSRGTVINGWIDGEPTDSDRAFSAEQNRTIELAYSRPPAQTQGSSGSEAASAIQRAITTAETYSDGVTVAISMETAKTTIDALKAHLGVSP